MIEKFKQLPLNVKLFILLAILLVIAIILRWEYIRHEASRSFNFFKHDRDTVTVHKTGE